MPRLRTEAKSPKRTSRGSFPTFRKQMGYEKKKNQYKLAKDTFSKNVLGA